MLFTIAISLFIAMSGGSTVQAHTLEHQGSIGAVMHSNPDDSPVVGQVSTFYFSFKDKEGKFSFAACNCSASVYKDDALISSQPLRPADDTDATFPFTFPSEGAYRVVVTGAPVAGDSFQPFTLEYLVRAEASATQSGRLLSLSYYAWALILLATILALSGIIRLKTHKKPS